DYFAGGSMHGDLALTEAMGSLKGFYKLVSLGVPFPSDRYGEYTGYKTDHDKFMRATSCGPLTSKYMTEALERACKTAGVPFMDGYRVMQVLTENGNAVGVVCLAENEITDENPAGLAVVLSGSLIWATGGPSAVYHSSVYPESQNCSLGAPLLAGVSAINLTESQYGIASIKFRWNLSGSYQQVIPRYVSVDENGVEREFLSEYFSDEDVSHAIFSKGYEWPFDPDKLTRGSHSSKVDMAVYGEVIKGRRVYMDFMHNPTVIENNGLNEAVIGSDAFNYLDSSNSMGETPIKRLRQMNERAYQLYLSHGIDLETEMLEISVCAQHLNGGLECNIWYENPKIKNFYPVGECGGVFGIKRPGGSALNSTQVGSTRAAQRVCALAVPPIDNVNAITDQLEFAAKFADLLKADGMTVNQVLCRRAESAKLHDECAAFIRDPEKIKTLVKKTSDEINYFFSENSACDHRALVELQINYDTLVTRYAMLSAISAYISDGGLSRGSYLIGNGDIPEDIITDTAHRDKVLITEIGVSDGHVVSACTMEPVRPIPEVDNWFENVYNAFGKAEMYK
ncbi:MAG: FAD-binding protein, partial [Ruminococcaceae bacterium]|nr:FAD-binding protein [Oscillospiraceae bacterium]